MRVLALDTTTRAGSVALVEDGRIVAEHCGDASRSHAERLPGDLIALLSGAGASMAAIDLFAVAAGPGSFTGLRTGIATMQGLAFVKGRRMVSVSSLEALGHIAAEALAPGTIVGAWMDAHRGEVFSARYRVADATPFAPERLVELDAASVGDPAATLLRWTARGMPAVVIGDGAVVYSGLLEGVARLREPPALAGAIGRMAVERARAGATTEPAAVQPFYIRRSDAEVERDRKNVNHEGPQGPEGG